MAERRIAPEGGKRRVLIENVSPSVDGGRYPVKRVVGDRVVVECDLVADGHDTLGGRVLFRRAGDPSWQSVALEPVVNDRWRASFVVGDAGAPDATSSGVGRWEFACEAWIDAYATWAKGTAKKREAGQPIGVELLAGQKLLAAAAARTSGSTATLLADAARRAGEGGLPKPGAAADAGAADASGEGERLTIATSDVVTAAMKATPDLANATRSDATFGIVVDPVLARFGAWYELFPRSCGEAGRHGTFGDVEKRLDYVEAMGFDILYMPPIHPIGRAFRKGPNNTLTAGPDDPGSPWAIGAAEGGHKAIHPELGTMEDFRSLVAKAKAKRISVALDIAFQVSPDHPYVKAHPGWFVHRADGTIQYAENPPKKYQDVYPFDFECEDWKGLWAELLDVFLFWCENGVRVFRVDNPHTKAMRFWEWCIHEVKEAYPEALFLAEAFTRPKVMYALAKGGFSQSYTYFTWRNTKGEFEEYLREIARPPVSDFYRPNFWPNTPDILPEHLQFGNRAQFVLRLALAATLSSAYGMYGPPFELMEKEARPGAEEYVDNEKFQLRAWDLDDPKSLRGVVALVNRARRENPALQRTDNVTFHKTDSDAFLCYSKRSEDGASVVLVVANMDTHHARSGWIDLDLAAMGVADGERFLLHDVVSDARQYWSGSRNYVELDPNASPFALFVVRKKIRSEQDFEYFL